MPTTQNNRNASAPRQPSEWDLRKLGCMWKRKKRGTNESYLAGVLNLKNIPGFPDQEVQWVGFSNKQKKEEKHPDVIIYISEKREDSSTTHPAARPAAPAPVADPTADDLI